MYCSKCGFKLTEGSVYCEKCGNKVEAPKIIAPMPFPTQTVPKKKSRKKGFLFALIGILTAAVITGGIFVYPLLNESIQKESSEPVPDVALYVKDGELFYRDIYKDQSIQVSRNLIEDESKFEDNEIKDLYNNLKYETYIKNNGKLVFFPDKITKSNLTVHGTIKKYSLYWRNMNISDSEPVKVDSDIWSYFTSKDGKYVVYVKGDDYQIYQYNTEKDEKEKLEISANDYMYRAFSLSDDKKRYLIFTNEEELYIKSFEEPLEKIDVNVSEFNFMPDSNEQIYYVKNGSLYIKKIGQEKEKIASNVGNEKDILGYTDGVKKAYKDGTMYYIKDLLFSESEYVDFDTGSRKFDGNDYSSSNSLKLSKIKEALDAICSRELTLCFFDGKQEKEIGKIEDYIPVLSDSSPIFYYTTYDMTMYEKVKASDFTDFESEADAAKAIKSQVWVNLRKCRKDYIAFRDKSKEITSLVEEYGYINKIDEKNCYFFKSTFNGLNDVYKASIENKELTDFQLIESDVASFNVTPDDRLIYFKDKSQSEYMDIGDLYIDGEKIDYDVLSIRYPFNGFYYKEITKSLYYLKDYTDSFGGTLKCFNNGEKTKISNDVLKFYVLSQGNVLYLKNYNKEYNVSDLYLYRQGESIRIDEDVSELLMWY